MWFRYGKDAPDVVKGLSLSIPAGAFFAVVGGNGTGKSTILSLISGVNAPPPGGRCAWRERSWGISLTARSSADCWGFCPRIPRPSL